MALTTPGGLKIGQQGDHRSPGLYEDPTRESNFRVVQRSPCSERMSNNTHIVACLKPDLVRCHIHFLAARLDWDRFYGSISLITTLNWRVTASGGHSSATRPRSTPIHVILCAGRGTRMVWICGQSVGRQTCWLPASSHVQSFPLIVALNTPETSAGMRCMLRFCGVVMRMTASADSFLCVARFDQSRRSGHGTALA